MAKKRRDRSGPRKHLTPDEVERLIRAAARLGRHGHRDATMIRVAFRHGFRVSELCDLTWGQIQFDRKIMFISRLKGGTPAVHDMTGPEIRDLRRVLRESPDPTEGHVFLSDRGHPLGRRFVHLVIARAARAAGLPIRVHPHTLRHSCGHAMANRGIDTRAIQAWLGHTNIAITAEYTALAEERLTGLW